MGVIKCGWGSGWCAQNGVATDRGRHKVFGPQGKTEAQARDDYVHLEEAVKSEIAEALNRRGELFDLLKTLSSRSAYAPSGND